MCSIHASFKISACVQEQKRRSYVLQAQACQFSVRSRLFALGSKVSSVLQTCAARLAHPWVTCRMRPFNAYCVGYRACEGFSRALLAGALMNFATWAGLNLRSNRQTCLLPTRKVNSSVGTCAVRTAASDLRTAACGRTSLRHRHHKYLLHFDFCPPRPDPACQLSRACIASAPSIQLHSRTTEP